MLIYNHKKEFIGIDEKDLHLLGFSSLSELMDETADFADMFVKTPGFIHNFQHVNWIDFVACSNSPENTKVIIHAKERNFQCQLSVNTAFLSDNPSTKAYLVSIINVKELTDNETDYISIDLLKQTTPKPISEPQKTPKKVDFVVEKEVVTLSPSLDTPISLDFDEDVEEVSKKEVPVELEEVKKQEETQEETQTYTQVTELFDNGYTYDPLVASSALGLPVDLIEEFIEDFIAQAKEFKDDLYKAFNNGDFENLKVLSHKLKGVAANLRIEDALESLTIINTSDKNNEIKNHLDVLYKIIAKLSKEKIVVTKKVDSVSQTPPVVSNEIEIDLDTDDDDMFTEPTDTVPSDEKILTNEEMTSAIIADKEVPAKIEMPELADDDYFAPVEENTPVQETSPLDEISMDEIDDEMFDFKELTENNSNESNETLEIAEPQELNLEIKEDLDLKIELDLEEPQAVDTIYDKKLVAEEIGLDEKSFTELLEDYISEAREISSLIRTAIGSNDSTAWSQQALKLKMMNENMRVSSLETDLDVLIQTKDSAIAQEASTKISELILEIEG